MADLELSSILNLISTAAVICALIFTALQVRAANYSRRDQAAITLIQTTQDASWTEALNLLLVLPENATAGQVRDQSASMERAEPCSSSASGSKRSATWSFAIS